MSSLKRILSSRANGARSRGPVTASHQLALLHRYEARLHNIRQRALENICILRNTLLPSEPRLPEKVTS